MSNLFSPLACLYEVKHVKHYATEPFLQTLGPLVAILSEKDHLGGGLFFLHLLPQVPST